MEPGKYAVRAVRGYWGAEAKSGNAPYVVTLEFLDETVKGHTMDAKLYFTDAAGERSAQSLKYLGLIGNPTSASTFRAGATAIAVVADETGNDGKVRQIVKWINGSGLKPADEGTAQRHADRAARFFNGGVPVREPGMDDGDDAPPAIDDSDIPY